MISHGILKEIAYAAFWSLGVQFKAGQAGDNEEQI